MRRVNWTITEQQHRELKRLSKETGLPISELVRRALDDYFRLLRSESERGEDEPESHSTEQIDQESGVMR